MKGRCIYTLFSLRCMSMYEVDWLCCRITNGQLYMHLYKIHNNNRHTAASISRLVKDLSHNCVCLKYAPRRHRLRLHTASIMWISPLVDQIGQVRSGASSCLISGFNMIYPAVNANGGLVDSITSTPYVVVGVVGVRTEEMDNESLTD